MNRDRKRSFDSRRRISVVRNDNIITINFMDHPACASRFLWSLRSGINEGYKIFKIKAKVDGVYPNACVPIAGIIDFYKLRNIDFSFDLETMGYLDKCGFSNPQELSAAEIELLAHPYDRLIKYSDSSQVAALTQSYIDSLSHISECKKGVIDGIIWCINEVMDNVLTHGETEYGFVMAQFHQISNHIAFCVYDSGIGIFNSLKNSKHHPRSSIDAISLSIQEGVGDGKGQGNGLFGLEKIVEGNGGRLTLTSGSASLMMLKSGERKSYNELPLLDKQRQTTTVDFQLDISKEIDIQTALQSIGGFDGFDTRIDQMINDDDCILYDIFENCSGTATRKAGEFLRNDVINILNRSSSPIILDFSKISNVSSSFIDEFISKLIVHLGIISFNQLIRIKGMNSIIKHLCQRSTYMRISEMWNDRESLIDNFERIVPDLSFDEMCE